MLIALAAAAVVVGLLFALTARFFPNNATWLIRLGAWLLLGGAILFGFAFPAIL